MLKRDPAALAISAVRGISALKGTPSRNIFGRWREKNARQLCPSRLALSSFRRARSRHIAAIRPEVIASGRISLQPAVRVRGAVGRHFPATGKPIPNLGELLPSLEKPAGAVVDLGELGAPVLLRESIATARAERPLPTGRLVAAIGVRTVRRLRGCKRRRPAVATIRRCAGWSATERSPGLLLSAQPDGRYCDKAGRCVLAFLG